jgi:hypothetical protein
MPECPRTHRPTRSSRSQPSSRPCASKRMTATGRFSRSSSKRVLLPERQSAQRFSNSSARWHHRPPRAYSHCNSTVPLNCALPEDQSRTAWRAFMWVGERLDIESDPAELATAETPCGDTSQAQPEQRNRGRFWDSGSGQRRNVGLKSPGRLRAAYKLKRDSMLAPLRQD